MCRRKPERELAGRRAGRKRTRAKAVISRSISIDSPGILKFARNVLRLSTNVIPENSNRSANASRTAAMKGFAPAKNSPISRRSS